MKRRSRKYILGLCRKGQKLCKTIATNRLGNPEVSYRLEPSGVPVTKTQAFQLLDGDLFEPTGDSLLEANLSQTWELKP